MSSEFSSHQRNKFLTFPYKLWQLMDECNDGAITWNATGESIVIDQTIFCTSICVKKIFKSVQWNSFVRQLNMYGFHKITIHQYSKELCQCQCHLSTSICYSHKHFRQRNFESLILITRPRKNSRSGFLNTVAENNNDDNDNASQTLVLTIENNSLENKPQNGLIEPTVPIHVGTLDQDFNNLDFPKETSNDPNNAFSVDFNVNMFQSFILHSHVVPSMNATTWTEMASSEMFSSNVCKPIATHEIASRFLYFSQSDATGQVLRAVPELEISFDDGVESMEIDDLVVQDIQLEFV